MVIEQKVLSSITIPEYITHVKLAEKRNPKYYLRGTAIPKKYRHLKNYDSKHRLLDENGELVIANPRTVGTPRLKKINGQLIYSSQNVHLRSKIKSQMHDFFHLPILGMKQVTNFPVKLVLQFGYNDPTNKPDIDNQSWIYVKAILDTMVKAGVIPDDTLEFVRGYEIDTIYTEVNQLKIELVKR